MEDEEFLLLDDDGESESSVPEKKSTTEKLSNTDSKDIISSISKSQAKKKLRCSVTPTITPTKPKRWF